MYLYQSNNNILYVNIVEIKRESQTVFLCYSEMFWEKIFWAVFLNSHDFVP